MWGREAPRQTCWKEILPEATRHGSALDRSGTGDRRINRQEPAGNEKKEVQPRGKENEKGKRKRKEKKRKKRVDRKKKKEKKKKGKRRKKPGKMRHEKTFKKKEKEK